MTPGNEKKKCKHFNGIQNGRCEIGIEYEKVKDSTSRPYKWPCIHCDLGTCSKREYLTDAEAEAEASEITKMIDQTMHVIRTIRTHAGGRVGVGKIECPVCKGELRYSIAALNGHIHAMCATKDCVAFMQ